MVNVVPSAECSNRYVRPVTVSQETVNSVSHDLTNTNTVGPFHFNEITKVMTSIPITFRHLKLVFYDLCQ